MIDTSELKRRRTDLMEKLGEGVFIIPSLPMSTYSNDVEYIYRQHSNMIYYVGYPEPETTCIIENSDGEIITHLFVPERDPKFETWFGRRYGIDGALKVFNIDKAYINSEFGEKLLEIIKNYDTIFIVSDQNDEIENLVRSKIKLALNDKELEGTGPINIINPIHKIHAQMVIKTDYEIELIKTAARISAEAHTRAIKVTKPSLSEFQIEALINYEFRKQGARTFAYPSIVGGGVNGTILHYIENSYSLKEGDLLLVDAGCEYKGYAADITRTWPINGKFTTEQKELYQMILDVQKTCITMAKPGVKFWDIHELSIKMITEGLIKFGLLEGDVDELIEEKKYKRFYMHGLGHWLGMDTHDTGKVNRKEALLEIGNYLTIEPGVYIPDEEDIPKRYRGIGIRIEDDILIIKGGNEILTNGVVKEIDEIEAIVGTEELP